MKIPPTTMPNTATKARSVQVFIKRVNITFVFLIFTGIFVMFLLIYMPLKNALEVSLIDNFSQISQVSEESLQNTIERGMEGARSLASRTVIKNAIAEYRSGEMNIEELAAFTQPKYEDGASVLEHLLLAERYVGDELIARYIPFDVSLGDCSADEFMEVSLGADARLCIRDEHVYLVVLSPILSADREDGYDKLIFDLTGKIHQFCTDETETVVVDEENFQQILADGAIVCKTEETMVFYKSGDYYHATVMQHGGYFVCRQSENTVFAPINYLRIQILITGIAILFIFTVAVYLYLVRFAKKELMDLETSRWTLKEAATEAKFDLLTNAGSRRLGTETLMKAFAEFKSTGVSPAIIVLDVDHLKQINDSHGHSAGDQLLIDVVDGLQKSIRNEDMLFRWGGDEFVGIIYNLKEEDAASFANKLLKAVSTMRIDLEDYQIRPSISLGLTYFKGYDENISDTLNRADQAMYQAKAEGRNRANIL